MIFSVQSPTLPDAVGAIANTQDFDLHLRESLFGEAKVICDGFCNIEHTAPNEWPAIIDADFGRSSIFKVCDLDHAGNRESFVGGHARPWPEFLTRGRLARKDQKMLGVMRSHANLSVTEGLARSHGMIADAAQRVGFGFVALDIRADAASKRHADKRNGR